METNDERVFNLVKDAGDLKNAICGLYQFAYSNIISGNATSDDLGALDGLITAVQLLAKKHFDDADDYYSKMN
ncbi:hypothetical protein [Enterococcus sp. AZ196]|uniref:hypothetical protein n=1 Tax=Enterococcus sp. AZ196 TaxID=2774659 RepID=UPI003D2BF8A7